MTLKTLSKITRALLYALMVLVAALMAALFISADVRTFMENEYGAAGSTVLFYAMLLVCGGIALWILIELAAVLKTVESDPFVERNAAAFMRMGIAAEAAGLVFFVKCFFMFTIMTAVCALVMILSGLFALTLSVEGRPLPAIQLNGVATTASHRGRGLSRRIIGRILEEHAGTPAFLFANDSVLEFYPRFGFRRAEDFLPVAEERLLPCPAARRITPDEARPLLEKRCQFSRVFDAADGLPIHLFHLYGECRDHIWQLSGETAAVAIQEGSTLRLLDVFGSRPTEWSEVRTRLPFSGIERIEFGFTPDFLKVDFHWERRPESRNLFLRGDFGLPEQFCFPALLET